ncbi:uncharacterized protein [Agelaius tricolor]|uniref:uncharacterized protein isoform X4 n=1 Tax=Agelaius tricolor TaxID=9191 RepID=UPI0039F19024
MSPRRGDSAPPDAQGRGFQAGPEPQDFPFFFFFFSFFFSLSSFPGRAQAAPMEFSELIKTATVEDVLLSRQGLPAVRGTLCITSHHLLLSSCPRGELELWLLIRNVDAVEKRWGCPQGCPCPLSPVPVPELEDPPLSRWAPHGHRAAPGHRVLPLPPPLPPEGAERALPPLVLLLLLLLLRVQNLGWYQPPRSGGSLRDTRVCGSSGTITLRCKDLQVLQLEIPGMEECLNIASSIEALSSVDSVMMLYPFFYRPPSLQLQQGWHLRVPERHFQRVASQTSRWRLSTVNSDFSACPSYPPAVLVPAAVADATVARAARFRQGGRFPVLSYFHPKNGTVSPGRPSAGPPYTPRPLQRGIPSSEDSRIGWEGILELIQPHPCHGRDTSHCPWVLQPGLGHCQGSRGSHSCSGKSIPPPPRQESLPNIPSIPALCQWEAIPCVLCAIPHPKSLSSPPGSPSGSLRSHPGALSPPGGHFPVSCSQSLIPNPSPALLDPLQAL